MTTSLRWTSADLEALPNDGKRYEIIDGELYVSRQPHIHHQDACGEVFAVLREWSKQSGLGRPILTPGLIFGDDDDVAPDVVWISTARLAAAAGPDGKLHIAPELVVEVLSAGTANQRRDREVKLKLYSRRGVSEYWVVDWRLRQIEIYRRENDQLHLAATLFESDALETPLLPGFACTVSTFFENIPLQP